MLRKILTRLLILCVFLALTPIIAHANMALPENLTAIEEQAFFNDTNLTGTLTIPDGVTTIGAEAFAGCTGLTGLVIPRSVTYIDAGAFSGCGGLTGKITLTAECSVAEDAFVGCTELSVMTETSADCFSYTISNGEVTITGYDESCGVTDVVVPEKIEGYPVTSIGISAFEQCSSLTSITIPDGVTSIGDSAFSYCSSLTSITIPDGVTSIRRFAFFDCSSLTSITIPDSVTNIERCAFGVCYSLTSITIPDGVTSIGDSAFFDCSSLTSITIPDSVTSIEFSAFANCSSLTSVTIPDSVTSIEGETFFNCYRLNSVAIPDSVTSIGERAFSHCDSLTSVTIPDSVTSIGESAFNGCISLTSMTIPNSVTYISYGAFHSCINLTSVTIPDSVTSIEPSAFACCSNLTSVTIPDSVTSIGESAFNRCSSLTSVIIPDSVTSIGESAFNRCSSLTSVTIPDSVTSIERDAFCGCFSLTSITIPDGVTSIGDGVFFNCSSLISITIPDSITTIESEAFYGCSSLTSVTIPDSVTTIEPKAFYGCTNLTVICSQSIWGQYLASTPSLAHLSYESLVSPRGELYDGDNFGIRGYVRATDPITNVTGTIWNSDKSQIIQTVSVSPGTSVYDLSGTVNYNLQFGKLATGKYHYTLSASTARAQATFVDTSFTIVESPMWVSISGFSAPEIFADTSSGQFPLSGTVKSNRKITSIVLEIVDTEWKLTAAKATATPNATQYDMSKMQLDISELPDDVYTLLITTTADGTSVLLKQWLFTLGNVLDGDEITDETREEIIEFLKNKKAGMFNPGDEVDQYLANMDLPDKISMGLSDYTNIATSKLKDLLSGSEYNSYMVKKYEAEISQILDELYTSGKYKDAKISSSVTDAIEDFVKLSKGTSSYKLAEAKEALDEAISKYEDNLPLPEIQTWKFIGEQFKRLDTLFDGIEYTEDFINIITDLMTDHSQDLAVLEIIADTYNTSGDAEFTVALNNIRSVYQSQYGKALYDVFTKVEAEVTKEVTKMVTGVILQGAKSNLYGLADTAAKMLWELTGVSDSGKKNVTFITQFNTLSSMQVAFNNASTSIITSYSNGAMPSNEQITKLQVTFTTARQALIRLYQTMIEIDAKDADIYSGMLLDAQNMSMPGVDAKGPFGGGGGGIR